MTLPIQFPLLGLNMVGTEEEVRGTGWKIQGLMKTFKGSSDLYIHFNIKVALILVKEVQQILIFPMNALNVYYQI